MAVASNEVREWSEEIHACNADNGTALDTATLVEIAKHPDQKLEFHRQEYAHWSSILSDHVFQMVRSDSDLKLVRPGS
jgi:hypothetical protein